MSVNSGRAILTNPLLPKTDYDALLDALGPVAMWLLDEPSGTTAQEGVNNWDGTYSGSFTLNNAPIRNGSNASAALTADSGTIGVPHSTTAGGIDMGTVWTVIAWIRPTLAHTGPVKCRIAGNARSEFDGKANWEIGLGGASRMKPYAYFSVGVAPYYSASPDDIAINTNYFIVGRRNGTSLKIDVNAVTKNNETVVSSPSDLPNEDTDLMSIGGGVEYPDSYAFRGRVSDVAVFDYYLEDADVSALYAAGAL